MNQVKNNQVIISGEITSDFKFSHEIYGEAFYLVEVKVSRLSEYCDVILVMVSERLVDVRNNCVGATVHVEGQFRSFNRCEERKSRLLLSVFAREFEFVDEEQESPHNNQICLEGYICKQPVYRKTPLGREIADVLLAVNRPYGKSDYIPCITWGRNALYASNLDVGSKCIVQGRIQSREYTKKISETESEERVAYEVSASLLEVVEDEK